MTIYESLRRSVGTQQAVEPASNGKPTKPDSPPEVPAARRTATLDTPPEVSHTD
jgi:hypothetical protein